MTDQNFEQFVAEKEATKEKHWNLAREAFGADRARFEQWWNEALPVWWAEEQERAQ